MKLKKNFNEKEYLSLLDYVISQMKVNGMKATTMDSIAEGKHISKRTLYEIFKSKENMFSKATEYHCKINGEAIKEIFDSSQNVMEAILRCFQYNRDMMSIMSVSYLKDLNQYYHSQLQKDEARYEKIREVHYLTLYDVLKKGVNEGYFRKDINLMVQCRMFILQMESLKRMEELFPKDITVLEVYDTIIIGFLRALCTSKGLEELEKFIPLLVDIQQPK